MTEYLSEYPEKHLLTETEREELDRTLGHMGYVLANTGEIPQVLERQDDYWPHGGIFRGED